MAAKALDKHVGVPDRPQRPAQPAQFGAQIVGPGPVQHRAGGFEHGPHPAHRNPHLMQLFGIFTRSGTRVVGEQGTQPGVQRGA